MFLKRGPSTTFTPEKPVERHFHEFDEAWVVIEGRARAVVRERDGSERDFVLQPGDVWMIHAGNVPTVDP